MNILPQKSWHVRTKKNIERVRRDEEKAAEEEKERQRKIALAEQEARTELLRIKARKRNAEGELEDGLTTAKRQKVDTAEVAGPSSSKAVEIYTNTGHINFFREAETGQKSSGKNAENEAEKKAEKEKWEKDIGLLTYLGQSAVETQDVAPWYLSKREKSKAPVDPKVKDEKLKRSLDPLAQMRAYVEKTDRHKHGHKDKDKHSSHKHKKKKKTKDKEKEKEKSSSKTIEQLRAERLKREQQERKRTQELLANKNKGQKSHDVEEPIDERRRGYNSVFNPDLVRRPKDRREGRHHYD